MGARDCVVMALRREEAAAKGLGERIDKRGKIERGVDVGRREKPRGRAHARRKKPLDGAGSAAFAA